MKNFQFYCFVMNSLQKIFFIQACQGSGSFGGRLDVT